MAVVVDAVTAMMEAMTTETIKTTTRNPLAPEGCLVAEQGDFIPWNNPEMIINRETDFWISTVAIGCVILPILFVLGVGGNILSVVVFCKQGLKDRINLCLFTLALADILVLISNFFLTSEKVYRDLVGFSGFMITYFPGITGVTWVSQFLSTVVASERCFCVVSPFHAKRFLKTSTMGVFIYMTSALLLGGMLAIAGPKHTAVCMFDPLTNETKDIVYVTDYYLNNKEILDLVDVWLYATALPFLFLGVVSLATTITVFKLQEATRWRQSTANTGKSEDEDKQSSENKMSARELALTRMLVATSVLFIVCLVPILMVQIATFLVKDLNYDGKYHNLTSVLWQCINTFRCLNSSMNFFIYFKMGSKFREKLREILHCGKGGKSVGSGSNYRPSGATGPSESSVTISSVMTTAG